MRPTFCPARFAALLFCVLAVSALPALSPYNAPGDTLTVIMRPILNVPAIHIPGEGLSITCLAPPSTTGWQVQLLHGNRTVDLPVLGSQYLSNPDRWELQALVVGVSLFELYDLRVTASGGIEDVTRNAVQVIPTRKTHFNFIHITDLHLPTRVYYPNAGFDSDSTSVNDFRSVIEDINLIRPEFVLLTGDLLNEGELEGFAGQHWYGWTQRLLEEIEVPCYVLAGNHDTGGWPATPPPAGSARRNWWRYFGWPWLDNADSNWTMHTQDYDFTYNNLHFIGLEAYDNYDNWRANIYGGQSFIYNQILWLNQRVSAHPDHTKVLFHHYDFSDQLNLSALGISLSLWGHIHSNSGSVSTFPYNLATRSVCNGNRAYRVIRVADSQVTPLTTIYAGSSGGNLAVNYTPSNNATSTQVTANVYNGQSIQFPEALLKFRMPPGTWGYNVTNGTLLQIDRRPEENICYVSVNLAANSSRVVTCAQGSVAVEDPATPALSLILSAWPNPCSTELRVLLDASRKDAGLGVYNLRGELVRQLSGDGPELLWDCRLADGRPAPAGIYILRAGSGSRSETRRVVLLGAN